MRTPRGLEATEDFGAAQEHSSNKETSTKAVEKTGGLCFKAVLRAITSPEKGDNRARETRSGTSGFMTSEREQGRQGNDKPNRKASAPTNVRGKQKSPLEGAG